MSGLLLAIGIATVSMLGGCSSSPAKVHVEPFGVPGKAALSADIVAEAMMRAGFEPEQILATGPAVRNAIAQQGGVRLRQGDFVRAMFMIHDDGMYGVAANRGTFRFDLQTSQVMDLGADEADNFYSPIP